MKASILFVAILIFNSTVFSQTNYSKETLEKIKEVENNITGNIIYNDQPSTIAERMAKYNVKGMSIAVIHDYKIVWAKGYGWADEAEKRPVTTETLFQTGSISKSLNSVGILKLAQDKKVDLTTDINTYLTSWKFPYDSVSKGKKITLAQILSHNAGLSTFGFPGYNFNGAIPTVVQILDGKAPAITSMRLQGVGIVFIPAVRSVFEPGLKCEYSGGGIIISQLLLTDVTKRAYDVWMYENVLKPIGMVNSFYTQPPPKTKQNLCAIGYYRNGSPVLNKFQYVPAGAGGLWMTPSDLCNYIIDMQMAYQDKKPSKILNSEMVKLHLTPYNNGPTSMGSFIEDHNGTKYFQHAAGGGGSCGQFYGSLDGGDGVVVFLNNQDGALLQEVINSVAKAYDWKNFYREPQKRKSEKSISVSDSVLKTYEGIYLFDNISWTGIGKRNNEYHFYYNNTYAKMYYTTPTRFFNEEFPSLKEFLKDAKGNIIGYTRTIDGKEYPKATKIISPDTLKLQSGVFADIGWYLFERGKYNESLTYFKRGAQLYPDDLNILISLAHLYLYNNDYKNAMAIYKAHLNDAFRPDCSWENMMQNDLIYLKEHHYDVKMFDKVFAELKIKKPKGY